MRRFNFQQIRSSLQVCLAVLACRIKASPVERQPDAGNQAQQIMQQMASAMMGGMEDHEKRDFFAGGSICFKESLVSFFRSK